MTARETFDIVVDVDRWASGASALADVIARTLDVPAQRIRPILDVKDSPVASYAYFEEASRVAARLASLGVPARVVEASTPRRSLQELTARASVHSVGTAASTGGAGVSAFVAGGTPSDRTVRPGWKDLSGGAEPRTAAGTVVGLPPKVAQLENTLVTARGEATPMQSDRVPDDEWDALASEAARSAPAVADDTAAPSQRPGWANILGDALSEQMADPPVSRPSAGGSVTAIVARHRAGRTRPQGPVTGEGGAGRGSAAASTSAEPTPVAAPPVEDPQHAPPSAASAWASAGVDIREAIVRPNVSVPAPARPMSKAPAMRPPSTGTVLFEAPLQGGMDDTLAPSAGVRAPTPAPEQRIAAKPPTADVPRAAAGPPAPPVAGMAAWPTPSEPPQFERVLPDQGHVEPRRAAKPIVVLGFGLLAPGAGFSYLGSGARGLTAALAGVFVVPWAVSAFQAFRDARAIEAGTRLADRPPQSRSAALHVAGFWLAVVAVALIVTTAAKRASEPRVGPDPAIVAATVSPVDTGATTDVTGSAMEDSTPEPLPAVDTVELELRLQSLLRDGRRACQDGRYFRCRQYAEQALAIDGRNREAQLLHVRAVSEGVVEPPSEATPETVHDRQPQRPTTPR